MERMFQLPPTTYIGGSEHALPLKEIINRLEVSRILFCLSVLISFTSFDDIYLGWVLLYLNSGHGYSSC